MNEPKSFDQDERRDTLPDPGAERRPDGQMDGRDEMGNPTASRKAATRREDPERNTDLPAAVMYLRVNNKAAGQPDVAEQVLQQQRARCEALATQRGWVLVGEFVEYGGGTDLARRPVLQRLIADIASGAVARVVAVDWARLTRSLDIHNALQRLLARRKVEILTGDTGSESVLAQEVPR